MSGHTYNTKKVNIKSLDLRTKNNNIKYTMTEQNKYPKRHLGDI